MQSTLTPGRHRKPTATRAFAARTAVSAGAAVAAVLLAGGPATAATATSAATVPDSVPAGSAGPVAEPPCTGTPLDAMIGPIIGSTCGSGEPGGAGEEDTGDPGSPPPPAATYPSVAVEDPPAPGGAPLPISCTGSPLDAFTTCGQSGHAANPGSDRGDAVGSDTPSYGQPPADEGDSAPPPAG